MCLVLYCIHSLTIRLTSACICAVSRQDTPSWKCEISYAFDTTEDPSLYTVGKVLLRLYQVCPHLTILPKELENLAETTPDFNSEQKPRRSWQNGKRPSESLRFLMTAPIFVTRTAFNHKEGKPFRVPYKVHPWLLAALAEDTGWIPNPERPTVLAYENDMLVDIQDSKPPYLETGDIIWFSFTVAFVMGKDAWGPEYRLKELVRVGKVPEAIAARMDPSFYPSRDPPLELRRTIIPIDGQHILYCSE